GLLLELRGFFVSAAESEQRDDVGFRQGRFGAVVEVEAAAGCADKSDVEVVVADVSGGLEIELRLDGNRVGKGDIATLERKASAVEGGLTFKDIDPAEDGGAGDGAAETKVGIAREAGNCSAHLEFRRGLDVDVEFDVIE